MSAPTVDMTTMLAVDAVAWGRAPRHAGGRINRRIICADGFKVSVQASSWHYANDSHPSGTAPYWRNAVTTDSEDIAYPFTTFEIGSPSEDVSTAVLLDEYESGGVWPWVPRDAVVALLDHHGGAVEWELVGP